MMLSVEVLKAQCKLIHYFGLGFIQLKVSDSRRYHFYTKELPPIVPEEDIHNHRYDFRSIILAGSLCQEIYQLLPGDRYVCEDESCKAEVKAPSKPSPCTIGLLSRHIYTAGSEYFIRHQTFHKVKAYGDCITQIDRTDYKKEYAQVVRPVNEIAVCPFSQKIEESRLWEIVGRMIDDIARSL